MIFFGICAEKNRKETYRKMLYYDVVFRNVEVFDGTGSESYVADVALKGDKIAKIGKVSSEGIVEVDGKGLSLAPGFVDVHTHSDTQLFSEPSRMCKLKQGVTFEIGGQCGWSRGPANPNIPQAGYDYYKTVNGGGRPIVLHPTYNSMLAEMASQPLGAHQMAFVGHHILRASTVGMEDREPTEAEMEKMKELLESAMKEGAPGFSTGLVYAPGCYSKTPEILELAKICAKYGGIYTTHMRDEADHLLEAVAETVEIARATGVTVNISHMKVMFKKNLPQLEKAVKLIEEANADGCNIFFDVYPYEACSATILSTLPPSYLSKTMDWLVEELSSKEGVAKLEKAIMEPTEVWENPLLNAGFDKDLIVWAKNTPDVIGKTIHDYAVEKGMTDVEAYAYIIAENKGAVTDVRFTMFNESLAYLYAHPLCALGTDGLYSGGGRMSHPRAFGSFPRYLGRLIREQKVLPFPEAIRRITGLNADRYHLPNKGYVKEGYDADLVLFNKDTIIDQATYADPFLPNIGIEMVFVSGQAAVVDNKPTGVFNGKVYKPAK